MRPDRRTVPGLAEAMPALESSLGQDSSPRNVMRVAEGLWLTGRPDRAIRLLKPLVDRDSTAIAPRVLLAWCCEDAEREDESLRLRGEVAALDPANPFAEPPPGPPEEGGPPEGVPPAPGAGPGPQGPGSGGGESPEGPTLGPREGSPGGEESGPAAAGEPEIAAGENLEREAEPERALTEEELRSIPPAHLYSATLGEIFQRQGFEEKALEIYREVVRLHPERGDLQDRIDTLEGRAGGEASR